MIGVSEKLNNYYLEELQKPNIGVVKNTQFGRRSVCTRIGKDSTAFRYPSRYKTRVFLVLYTFWSITK